ncbi:lysophospholipid acyltransferase family protein [Methylocella sp.]|uniref:lysophospholipid acyltransferase family protein n=1 Tax=Methylocella sp. TaxID=1978226 RepID=UPI0035B33B44
MIVLRSIVFNILFYANMTALALAGLPTLAFGRRAVQGLARLWARSSLRLLSLVCGQRVEFRGLENLPSGGCLIAAKHQSALETFAMTTQLGDFTFVLKRELTSIPFFGWYLKGADQIAIERARRGQALADMARAVSAALGEGRQVLIFPEGTRTAPGAAPAYKAGVSHLYVETGAVCVPVALNTGLFWPRRGLIRRPGVAVIEFLPPIPPGLDKQKFMTQLQARVEQASDRLADEAFKADPALADAPAVRSP